MAPCISLGVRRLSIPTGDAIHDRASRKIRARAYELWLADGGRSGNAEAYWYGAERELAERADISARAFPAARFRRSRGRLDVPLAEDPAHLIL